MTSTSAASATGPEPIRGADPTESPEQLLRRESERIAALLQARRKATLVISVVFALATAAAVFLLARYIQDEQKQIQALGTQLADYQAWRTRLDGERALVDSILDNSNLLIAGVRDSTRRYSEQLVIQSDSALRTQIQAVEERGRAFASSGDSAWNLRARAISDSLGRRLVRAEGSAARIGDISQQVTRHSTQLATFERFSQAMNTSLTELRRDVGLLERGTRRDTLAVRGMRTEITRLQSELRALDRRLSQLEARRVRPDSTS